MIQAGLMREISAFREWAKEYPPAQRYGEWECDYPDWEPIYTAAPVFFEQTPFDTWSMRQRDAVLYILARDNEARHLAGELRERFPHLLIPLTRAAVRSKERDARWQLAVELGKWIAADAVGDDERREVEELLQRLARDPEEYVRRRALEALTRIGSNSAERLALQVWWWEDADQQWSRMMALDCLRRIGSSHLESLLTLAERDERPYLRDYANRLRQAHGTTSKWMSSV